MAKWSDDVRLYRFLIVKALEKSESPVESSQLFNDLRSRMAKYGIVPNVQKFSNAVTDLGKHDYISSEKASSNPRGTRILALTARGRDFSREETDYFRKRIDLLKGVVK